MTRAHPLIPSKTAFSGQPNGKPIVAPGCAGLRGTECFGGNEGLGLRANQAYAPCGACDFRVRASHAGGAARRCRRSETRDWRQNRDFRDPLDDGWARDIGPTFLRIRRAGLPACSGYSMRGATNISPIPMMRCSHGMCCRPSALTDFSAPMVCEGGALHGDGEGTIADDRTMSAECEPKSRTLPREDVETLLHLYLGAQKVIWIEGQFSGR